MSIPILLEKYYQAPLSINQNSDIELYDWKIENYESKANLSFDLRMESSAPLKFKERDSLVNHGEQITKYIREQVRMKSLVQTFTRKISRWWWDSQDS